MVQIHSPRPFPHLCLRPLKISPPLDVIEQLLASPNEAAIHTRFADSVSPSFSFSSLWETIRIARGCQPQHARDGNGKSYCY
jgi:hypothetical protein